MLQSDSIRHMLQVLGLKDLRVELLHKDLGVSGLVDISREHSELRVPDLRDEGEILQELWD